MNESNGTLHTIWPDNDAAFAVASLSAPCSTPIAIGTKNGEPIISISNIEQA